MQMGNTDRVVTYYSEEIVRLADEARAITRKADDEGRALTATERQRVETNIAQVTALKGRIQEHRENEQLLAAIGDASGKFGAKSLSSNTPGGNAEGDSIGAQIVKSGLVAAMKEAPSDRSWLSPTFEFGFKVDDGNSTTITSITDASGVLPLNPQVLPVVGPVEQELTVAALFGSGVATKNTVTYLEETSTTAGVHDADPYGESHDLSGVTPTLTDEADLKPAAHVDFTQRGPITLDKIAVFLPVSEEFLEDEAELASYITSRLPLFVRQAEEAYLLDTLNVTNTADPTEIGGDPTSLFDAIAAGIVSVKVDGGLTADALLINPFDLASMQVQKDGEDRYLGGSPFGPSASNPWGLKTVVTTAVAPGSAIVGAFREGGTVYRKGSLRVDASNSHLDYFQRNLVALRAEERLLLVVRRPDAFVEVSVASS